MSIASDYAKRCDAALVRPTPFELKEDRYNQRQGVTAAAADVSAKGDLIVHNMHLDPKEAIRLAKWIIDTFGEPVDELSNSTGTEAGIF